MALPIAEQRKFIPATPQTLQDQPATHSPIPRPSCVRHSDIGILVDKETLQILLNLNAIELLNLFGVKCKNNKTNKLNFFLRKLLFNIFLFYNHFFFCFYYYFSGL